LKWRTRSCGGVGWNRFEETGEWETSAIGAGFIRFDQGIAD